MQARVRGNNGASATSKEKYIGLDLMDRTAFIYWSEQCPIYKKLFAAWVESDFSLRLSPSIDRIDALEGYTQANIRWVTMQENCSGKRQNRKITPEVITIVNRLSLSQGMFQTQIAKRLGISQTTVSQILRKVYHDSFP